MGFGSLLGRLAGTIGSALLPIKGVDGGELGAALGSLAPFKKGGRVPRTGRALIHKGGVYFTRGRSSNKGTKSKSGKG